MRPREGGRSHNDSNTTEWRQTEVFSSATSTPQDTNAHRGQHGNDGASVDELQQV